MPDEFFVRRLDPITGESECATVTLAEYPQVADENGNVYPTQVDPDTGQVTYLIANTDTYVGSFVVTNPIDGDGSLVLTAPILDASGAPTGDVRTITIPEPTAPETDGVHYSGPITFDPTTGVVTIPTVNDIDESPAAPEVLDLSVLLNDDIQVTGDLSIIQLADGTWQISHEDPEIIDADGAGGIQVVQNANGDWELSVTPSNIPVRSISATNGVENTGTAADPILELDIDSLPPVQCVDPTDLMAVSQSGVDVSVPVGKLLPFRTDSNALASLIVEQRFATFEQFDIVINLDVSAFDDCYNEIEVTALCQSDLSGSLGFTTTQSIRDVNRAEAWVVSTETQQGSYLTPPNNAVSDRDVNTFYVKRVGNQINLRLAVSRSGGTTIPLNGEMEFVWIIWIGGARLVED